MLHQDFICSYQLDTFSNSVQGWNNTIHLQFRKNKDIRLKQETNSTSQGICGKCFLATVLNSISQYLEAKLIQMSLEDVNVGKRLQIRI